MHRSPESRSIHKAIVNGVVRAMYASLCICTHQYLTKCVFFAEQNWEYHIWYSSSLSRHWLVIWCGFFVPPPGHGALCTPSLLCRVLSWMGNGEIPPWYIRTSISFGLLHWHWDIHVTSPVPVLFLYCSLSLCFLLTFSRFVRCCSVWLYLSELCH